MHVRKLVLLLATVALGVVLAAPAAQAQSEGAVLDASARFSEYSLNTATTGGSGDVKLVQTFVAQNSGYLKNARVALSTNGYSVQVPIQVLSLPQGDKSAQVLAETTVTAMNRYYSPRLHWATFAEPAYVEAGQTYGLAIVQTPEVRVSWVLSPWSYPDGELRALYNGTTWSYFTSSIDAAFYTYVILGPPPEPPAPTTKEECKEGGYTRFADFKNQGDCVSFVATGKKNEPGKNVK